MGDDVVIMRILLVHNYYGSTAPSGENRVFEAERALLERHGHEVATYVRHSDEIRTGGIWARMWGKIKGACCTIGNPFAAWALAKKCRAFRPDIVHFHNTFPLISPLAVWAASRYAPVVMTLHNYRTMCAAGVPMRNGKVCSRCLDKRRVWDAIGHRCYRGSLLATLPLAVNIALYRRLLPRWVSRFIVLSGFQKRKMVECGWPEEKIVVKGNSVETGRYGVTDGGRTNQLLFVGRLSDEKGVATLIEAFRLLHGRMEDGSAATFSTGFTGLAGEIVSSHRDAETKRHGDGMVGRDVPSQGLKLVLIGDGDGRGAYESLAKGLDAEFWGGQSSTVVRKAMAESKALVLSSECWETFGLSAVEAMAEGTPCVVSDLGALPDIVRNGRLGEVFSAGNVASLADAIVRLLSRPDYDELCRTVRREAETRHSEEANCRRLMEIYDVVRGV